MIVAAAFVLAAAAAALPAAHAPTRDVDRTPIRCRPAPYFVADGGVRPRLERIVVTGSRIPRDVEKKPRPCLLMRTLSPPAQHIARVAN